MSVMVVLLHSVPDGSCHYDWLLSRADGSGPLISWRLAINPRTAGGGATAFDAVRMQDHRRVYLEFEGEVSGGRGSVVQVARGECVVDAEGRDTVRFHARFEGESGFGAWEARAKVAGGGSWELRREV